MSFHPDDRPDPSEQPIRARVPEHVAGGCFSTGVIVMTAQTEFILDFVQNLGRPHQIVARVVMPHGVLPQLVDALGRNIQLYRGRWGELPSPIVPNQTLVQAPLPGGTAHQTANPVKPNVPLGGVADTLGTNNPQGGIQPFPVAEGQQQPHPEVHQSSTPPTPNPTQSHQAGDSSQVRQASAQEIYDDLKIKDELLSGSYANAVMIGHGPHEFSFDFITNFYPHSAVSSRVFLAAGQIPRLYESLKGTWEQLRQRMQPPNNPPPME
jgi:Protein of unknown function (DUF3467)